MSALSISLLAGLFDDAAIFPPGNAPLPQAVADHATHLRSPYAAAVGPLVVRAADLAAVGDVEVAVVTGPDGAHAARAAAGSRLAALEVALPDRADADEVRALATLGVPVHVEVPRDGRRTAVLAELAATGLRAKFRTGGPSAEHVPPVEELATAIASAVALGVPFKATAGLHHALRHTDPETGMEQHGFLNLIVATARARSGAAVAVVEAALACRDEAEIVPAVRRLGPDVRGSFLSFGTCSISEPLEDLARLDLLPAAWTGVSA